MDDWAGCSLSVGGCVGWLPWSAATEGDDVGVEDFVNVDVLCEGPDKDLEEKVVACDV